MSDQKIAQVSNNQLIINSTQKKYNIYDIAFIEIIKEEIKFHKYIFVIVLIINSLAYFNLNANLFSNFLIVTTILFSLTFVFKINISKYKLLLSFKEFKYREIAIKKKQLLEAENLIEQFKNQYQIIDQTKKREHLQKRSSLK